jgi:hypothetical protein
VQSVGAQQPASDQSRLKAAAAAETGHVPHSDTPHTLISRSGRDLGLTSPGAAAGVLGRWVPGREVRRNGVEVATAAGSLTRDSTSAISWSPNFLLLVPVVRRCDVTRKPALMANPIARPFPC